MKGRLRMVKSGSRDEFSFRIRVRISGTSFLGKEALCRSVILERIANRNPEGVKSAREYEGTRSSAN